MDKPLNILLMGDTSNCHRTLASGLRRLGQNVTVVSDGTQWMNTDRDIDIARRWNNKLGGMELWARLRLSVLPRLKDFDVVSLFSPNFLQLRPVFSRKAFDILQAQNRSIFLTALATDTAFVEECLDPVSQLKYNEFRVFGRRGPYDITTPGAARDWTSGELRKTCEKVYGNIDGAVSVLYEYNVSMSRVLSPEMVAYGGLPIDLKNIRMLPKPEVPGCVNLFLGRHVARKAVKGTDILEEVAKRVISRHPGKCKLTIVENRPYDEYLGLLKSAHLVLDQIYSYTPAMNALLAMAYGIPVLSGGEPDFYDFIGEYDNRPIINASPEPGELISILEDFVCHPERIPDLWENNRSFVEKHNDCETVAARFLEFWNKRLKDTGK